MQTILPSGHDFELIDGFFSDAEGDELMAQLCAEAHWRDEHLQMFGKRLRSPRRVCWYGDAGVGYVYSGELHCADGWLPALEKIKTRLANALAEPFNFVLLNYYRDEKDSMGWHSDNEPELGPRPVIASLSMGATRTFRIRPAHKTPGVRRISQTLELQHGSLLIMRGQSQQNYQHALPKSTKACGSRLNLTFRQIYD